MLTSFLPRYGLIFRGFSKSYFGLTVLQQNLFVIQQQKIPIWVWSHGQNLGKIRFNVVKKSQNTGIVNRHTIIINSMGNIHSKAKSSG